MLRQGRDTGVTIKRNALIVASEGQGKRLFQEL
jgi:hypothetical protein